MIDDSEVFTEFLKESSNHPNIAAIQDENNRARIVFGHDRNGTGGVGNHPFTYEWNGRTYTFQQIGALSSDGMESMKSRIFNGLYYQGWFEQFPPGGPFGNWSGNPNNVDSWIDSELFFHYLMAHVIAAEGDVVAGLRAALSEHEFYGFDIRADITTTNPYANPPSVVNFVLSDGESLYAFRNSHLADSGHELSYRQFPSGLAGVWTNNGAESHEIDRYQLAILPPSGSVILLYPNGVVETKTYHNGSNWVCFPVLPTTNGPAVQHLFAPLSHAHLISNMHIQHETYIDAVWNGEIWTPGGNSNIISTKGYKVNINEGSLPSYEHSMFGEKRVPENTLLTLHAGWNYVPYFLEDSQHPSEAFPQAVLDVLLSIKSESWFMIQRNGEFVVKKQCGPIGQGGGSVECYTLEYGAMYEVYVSAPVSFRWNQPNDPPYPYEEPLTVYYEPDKKPDYMPVVIEEMENGEGILEIAAFQDGVCVGAEVVDGYPVNLQVYVDDLSGVTFEAVAGGGIVQLASAGEQTAPSMVRHSMVPSGAYQENGAVFMNMRQGAAEPLTTPADFRIVSAYPNPFNPTTTLRIQLSGEMQVSLGIYNLQGRLVARLVDGRMQAGEHELSWSGDAVASGVYYGVLSDGSSQSVQKLLLLK